MITPKAEVCAMDISRLSVLYDASCSLCCTLRQWMAEEASYVELSFVALQSEEAVKLYPSLRLEIQSLQFIVVDNLGGVYFDDDARLLCLWALKRYRRTSLRLAQPALRGLVNKIFQSISSNRHGLSQVLGLSSETLCECETEVCKLPNTQERI